MVAQRQGTGVAADEPAKDSVEVKADIQVEVKVEGDGEKTDSRKRKNDSDDHPAKRKKTTHKVNLTLCLVEILEQRGKCKMGTRGPHSHPKKRNFDTKNLFLTLM